MAATQPATIAFGEVYAPDGSHALKAIDQLHLMLGWLREDLARTQNVARETLAVEGEILRGEIFLKDFTRESRYEIHRMETKAISEFPDVDLDLVVLPRKIEE